MRTVNLNLDDSINLTDVQADVATGVAKLDGEYIRWVHVMAAREYTVPLAYETTAEDALRLAAAVIEWDVWMTERADDPYQAKWGKLTGRETIRSFLPKMHACELRELFVETYGLADEVR